MRNTEGAPFNWDGGTRSGDLPARSWILAGLFVIVFSLSSLAQASKGELSGLGLQDARALSFLLEPEERILVRATQTSADYMLHLFDEANSKPLKSVDFSSYLGFEELILVSGQDCGRCKVVIEAKEEIDKDSPYLLTLHKVVIGEKAGDGELALNNAAVLALEDITRAGQLSFAQFKNPSSQAASPKEVASLLASASSGLSSESSWVSFHAASIRYHFLANQGDRAQAEQILRNLIEINSTEHWPYTIQAFYEVAAYESDRSKMFAHNQRAMELAKSFEAEIALAQGLNFDAVNLVNSGNFSVAFANLEQARQIYQKHRCWRKMLDVLHNLSWAHQREGELPKAIALATEQRLFSTRYGDITNEAWALYNLSLAYGELGERAVADTFAEDALELLKQRRGLGIEKTSEKYLQAYLLTEIAQRSLQYGAFAHAMDFAEQAENIYVEISWPNQIADARFLIGRIHHLQGDPVAAETFYTQAIEHDLTNNRRREGGQKLVKFADLKLAQNKPIAAAKLHVQALENLSETEDRAAVAEALVQSTQVLVQLEKYSHAKAVALDARALVEGHASSLSVASFHFHLAEIERHFHKYSEALEHLGMARELVEVQLGKLQSRELRARFLALHKKLYSGTIALLARQGAHTSQLVQLAEEFRARNLLEKVNAVKGTGINVIDTAARDGILSEIRKYASSVLLAKDSLADESQIKKLRGLSRTLERLESATLEKRVASLDLNSLGDTVSTFEPNEIIANYFVGETESWLWVYVDDQWHSFELPGAATLGVLAQDFWRIYSIPPHARQGVGAWEQQQLLKKVSDTLLGPIANLLAEPGNNRLTIIADDVLGDLSIAALTVPGSGQKLVEHLAISHSPSLRIRNRLNSGFSPAGNSTEPIALIISEGLSKQGSSAGLAPLEYASAEAQMVAKYVGAQATLLQGIDAVRENVLARLYEPYEIIHFTTHGLVDTRNYALSGLVLSGSRENTLLLAPEISALNLSETHLVVLSACEGLQGQNIKGEGAYSLTRAFMEAGARRVIGAQWKIEDQSASVLMDSFYYHLLEKQLSVAEALRMAQLDLMRSDLHDWRDPYYWAGYKLVGA